ncbi:hypothetical protein EV193_101982 [Herbihabitans rhizosphaerae]|uniref:DSBA-like thioredoxin domain-containing protein n=1 Tax=Herbihabitans rhizosphaerae TaxID=1872711 RepID=A0A4Q7L6V2_9PSEU|nr:disulfide bond formation protein DsbA [Herbihabitans rhizosphaerae]RZS45095.1 hypothetical protein EV193_101982 [Herbihabitans rhizosphaerae]
MGAVLADFWLDPICPYTWITSRWMIEVTKVRPVQVRWRTMCLSVLNEHLEVDPEDPEGLYGRYMRMPARVCLAAQQDHGHDAMGRLFTAMGARMHGRGEWDAIGGALADAGLPAELARAAEDTGYDDALRTANAEAMALAGPDVGSPVIAVSTVDGPRIAFFGPVVSPEPRGEDAGRLWDAVLLIAGVDAFAELKRGRG